MANYINNEDFLNALLEYKNKSTIAKNNNESTPKVPNYIGECFLKIAENLTNHRYFIGYTQSFKDEMISDAVLNCLSYFRNFDVEKSKNPFSYFTQITYYAFRRRIIKEKKMLYIKYKATQQFGILDEGDLLEDENGNYKQFELYDNINEFIQTFEESVKKKKTKAKNNLDKFYENEILTLNEFEDDSESLQNDL